jgi:type II secretory pathway pseudopilin PulG
MKLSLNKHYHFTLPEVLVSLMLLTLIITASMAALMSTKESAHMAHLQESDYKKMNAVLNLMRRDLQHLLYPRGDEEILHTEQVDMNTGRADSIHFIRLPQIINNPDNLSSINEVSYISSPNPENEEVFNLYRRFQDNFDSDINQGGRYELLLNNLVSFELNYLEGTEWTSAPTILPRAIAITIILLQDDGRGGSRKVHLETIITLKGQA